MNNQLTTIYLVRHGQSEGNAKAKEKGIEQLAKKSEYGTPLTDIGKEQARTFAQKIKHMHFDAIFSSDLLRAQQTAEIIAMERKIAVKTTNAIRERSFRYPIEKDKTIEQMQEEIKHDLSTLDEKAKHAYKYAPHLESAEEAATRLITFLREIAISHPGKTVLVVNHGNVIRSFLSHLGWATYNELPAGSVKNTAYVIMECDGVDFFIKETTGITKEQNAQRIY